MDAIDAMPGDNPIQNAFAEAVSAPVAAGRVFRPRDQALVGRRPHARALPGGPLPDARGRLGQAVVG